MNKHLTEEDRARLKQVAARLATPKTLTERIIETLKHEGPATRSELAISLPTSQTKRARDTVRTMVSKLIRAGKIRARPSFDPAAQGRGAICKPLELLEVVE